MSYAIYVLRDPLTNEDRYVGCTKRPLHERLSCHMSEAKAHHFREKPTWVWLRGLSKMERRPIIALIDEAPTQDLAYAIESWWIAHKRSQGDDLLNFFA